MSDILRCIVTPGLFLALPYLLRWFLSSGMTRRHFALATSLSLGIIHFLLGIMFVKEDTFIISAIVSVSAIIGTYLPGYLMYPALKKAVAAKAG